MSRRTRGGCALSKNEPTKVPCEVPESGNRHFCFGVLYYDELCTNLNYPLFVNAEFVIIVSDKDMSNSLYAHSLKGKDRDSWQSLEEHSHNVGCLAAEFAITEGA